MEAFNAELSGQLAACVSQVTHEELDFAARACPSIGRQQLSLSNGVQRINARRAQDRALPSQQEVLMLMQRKVRARKAWRRLQRISPIVARFAFALEDIYMEVTSRPGLAPLS